MVTRRQARCKPKHSQCRQLWPGCTRSRHFAPSIYRCLERCVASLSQLLLQRSHERQHIPHCRLANGGLVAWPSPERSVDPHLHVSADCISAWVGSGG